MKQAGNSQIPVYLVTQTGVGFTDEGIRAVTDLVLNDSKGRQTAATPGEYLLSQAGAPDAKVQPAAGTIIISGEHLLYPNTLMGYLEDVPDARIVLSMPDQASPVKLCPYGPGEGGLLSTINALKKASLDKTDSYTALLRLVYADKNQKLYENAMRAAMAACCIAEDISYHIINNDESSPFSGESIRVYDELSVTANDAGILRIGFTADFSNTDNMPLVYKAGIPACGHGIKIGIRTGSKTQGFIHPVVMIGIDADNDDEQGLSSLHAAVSKDMGLVLKYASQALAAYLYQTDNKYAFWLQENAGPGSYIPEEDAFLPNYNYFGAGLPAKPGYQTIPGLRLAYAAACRDALWAKDQTSREFVNKKAFIRQCGEALNMIRESCRERAADVADIDL